MSGYPPLCLDDESWHQAADAWAAAYYDWKLRTWDPEYTGTDPDDVALAERARFAYAVYRGIDHGRFLANQPYPPRTEADIAIEAWAKFVEVQSREIDMSPRLGRKPAVEKLLHNPG